MWHFLRVTIHRRVLVCSTIAAGVTLMVPAVATAVDYGLVHPRTCLAGDWGKPTPQWRIQLGVFEDEAGALLYQSSP